MAVAVPADVLTRYRRFTLYNSPYRAHRRGCAIDLYPEEGVPSPVSGEVLETRTVSAPSKPYAPEHDHLILVDTGDPIARMLHVDPDIERGDRIGVGDSLGDLVRAGFFAPWVDNHIHLGFRDPDTNPYRASGSVRIELGVRVTPVDWDGTGTVVEAGPTWARLDSPAHPAPGECFAGLASDGAVLDGGFPHYAGGGLLGSGTRASIVGSTVGSVAGRDVTWRDCTVRANGRPVTGLALFCDRETFGIKLVGESVDLAVGDDVTVTTDCG